jgi:hypothetical protein
VPGPPTSSSFIIKSDISSHSVIKGKLNKKKYLKTKGFKVTTLRFIPEEGWTNNAGSTFQIRDREDGYYYFYFSAYREEEDGKRTQMKIQDNKIAEKFPSLNVVSSKMHEATSNVLEVNDGGNDQTEVLIRTRTTRRDLTAANQLLKDELELLRAENLALKANSSPNLTNMQGSTESEPLEVIRSEESSFGPNRVFGSTVKQPTSSDFNPLDWKSVIYMEKEAVSSRLEGWTEAPEGGYYFFESKLYDRLFIQVPAYEAEEFGHLFNGLPPTSDLGGDMPYFKLDRKVNGVQLFRPICPIGLKKELEVLATYLPKDADFL